MALDTYTNLKAAAADWLNRTDLTSQIPDFITLAEAQINRRLMLAGPVRQMMGRSDATINAEFFALPSDFLGLRAFSLGTTTGVPPLTFVEPEKIVELKVNSAREGGDPQHFSIVGAQFQFWPWTSGGSFSAEISYWKSLPPLASNATNWLLALYPDAYLYGSLLQSAPYLKHDARIQTWGTAFAQVLADIVDADKVARFAPQLGIPRKYSIV